MRWEQLKKCKAVLYSNAGLLILVLIFLVSVIIFFKPIELSGLDSKEDSDPVLDDTELKNSTTNSQTFLNASDPISLQIPKLGVYTDFEDPLGLVQNGEVDVPDSYTKVGWYKYGPTPGEIGPSVILGHVDSIAGPAVFYSLGQLSEGDDIFILRADGSTAHFQVTKLERYKQTDFSTEKVYGDIDHAGLRLITCSGIFNRGQQRYSHNLVVYAKLVG